MKTAMAMDLHWLVAFVAIICTSTAVENTDLDLVELKVDDKVLQYSMTENPPVDSPVVQAEMETLRGALDLESFAQDLGRVGKYIRVAYNGIGAAGPKFQALQNEVQRLGFDISKLCDKSAVTIASFKTTTRAVLFELKAAYQYLLKNWELIALDSFAEIAELAGKMAIAAEKLQNEFESQDSKVLSALEETQRVGAEEKLRISDLRAQQERTRANVKIQDDLANEHRKLEEEARAERRRYERKEDKAMSSKSGFLSRLGNVITSSFGLGSLFDDDSSRALKANRWRQKSIEKLENEKEQRKLKQEALRIMAELIHDIKAMGEEKDLADVASKALHKASGSLKQLIHLLRQASLFWNQLKEHCLRLADDKLQQKIKKFVAKFNERERREYWTSNEFKQRMFLFVSKWIALHSVSSDYLEHIKLTQQDLYKYILENPTHEESMRNLQKLADNFEDELMTAQEEIEKRNIKTDNEIRQLTAEQNKIEKTEL